jgi:hypothetical protein
MARTTVWGVDTIFGFPDDRWKILKTVMKDKIREVV